ncbi:MAG: hypothetical protein FWG94_05320 [Oscillospiraceae bacterium]|nr:hypothetical protein [Oscillospiraceae bacterium]
MQNQLFRKISICNKFLAIKHLLYRKRCEWGVFLLYHNPQNLQQCSEMLWLTKPYVIGKNQDRFIGICIKQQDGSFASVDALRLDHDGIYHYKKTKLGTVDSQGFRFYIDSMTKKLASFPAGEDELSNEICEYYLEVKTIKQTARKFGLSEQRIRRTLISKGHYASVMGAVIRKMFLAGKTINDISKELDMPRKQIISYLPYD